MSEFYSNKTNDDSSKHVVFKVGKLYATPLTAFLAGLAVGLLAMYIIMSLI